MIIGWYQGIPLGGRVVERDGQVFIELYPILPGGPDGGETLAEAA
jgi:hypothetical protein